MDGISENKKLKPRGNMHELAICSNIIKILKTQVVNKKIKKIWLRIGEISGVNCDAIQFSFPIAARNTIAENAEIELIHVHARGKCNTCHAEIKITTLFDACQYCNNYDYEIIQGNELQIIKVEVE
jgi:hydrogenase nickel incorporation protein HypA/HybF